MGDSNDMSAVFTTLIKKVMLSAPVFTESGYGVHSRQVASWLLAKHKAGKIQLLIHAVPWGNTPWIIDKNALGGLIGELQQLSTSPTTQCDVAIQLKLPNEWTKMALVNIGITAGVETDRANPAWAKSCSEMDLVIVPSDHVRKALNAAGNVGKEIVVVPEAFPESFLSVTQGIEKTEISSAIDLFPTKFNFLIFGQLTGDPKGDRKNTFNTLKWISEAFANDSDVGIILKTNMGRNSLIDREITTASLRQWCNTFRKKSGVPVHLIHGSLAENEVASVYTHPNVKAIVSLTRGEGYGLPLLEAAACGVSVIATDWSGHLDFMNCGKFISINYDLKEIPQSRVDNSIFMKGTRWAEVREDDFKRKILKFRTSNSIPKEWAKNLQKLVHEKFCPVTVYSHYDSVLGKYFGEP